MNLTELEHRLQQWLRRHYPELDLPDSARPLGAVGLLNYYDHLEIAMLELDLHDRFPNYLALVRKRRNYLRRLQGVELKKEQFRSLSSF